MKSLMLFLAQILDDLEDMTGTSTSRDRKTIAARVKHEGFSFLTITLAKFGQELQKALDQGFVDHTLFTGFRFRGGLPQFLGGYLDRVFDRRSGRLLDEPSVEHIIALRQITLMWAKIQLPCTDVRVRSALRRYVECEQNIRSTDAQPEILDKYQYFDGLSVLLWGKILSDLDLAIEEGAITPGHGPGSTADGLFANAKWSQTEWTVRLEREFSSGDFLIPSARYWSYLDQVDVLEPGRERPVKVVLVPKTLEKPRVIAEEPTCMQYVQQGLLRHLTEAIEADDMARRFISWGSSLPNQQLARRGSSDGSLATLDLKDASDSVSNQLVRRLLCRHPIFRDAVEACRSRKADVPGIGVIRLAKFASMGSALTFPIESMVFLTVVLSGISRKLNRRMSRGDLKSFLGRVRIYGDDIIVPVEFAVSVQSELELFGFKVNSSKSYWTGKFRESCGGEYYDGHDVSIVKVRRVFATHRRYAREVVSMVALRNQCYTAGFWKSARYLDTLLTGLLNQLLPRVSETSQGLGRHSFLGYEIQRTEHDKQQRPLVKAYVLSSPSPDSHLDGVGALLKCLVHDGAMPNPDPKHLERAGRPRFVSLKARWVTPF